MTAAEIVETFENRTWKERSIYTMLNSLVSKGVVTYSGSKPTTTNSTKSFIAAITAEEYALSTLEIINDDGRRIATWQLKKSRK